MVGSHSHGHHSIEGEVQEREVHEEEIPEELASCPFKSHHGIYHDTIYNSLNQDMNVAQSQPAK